MNKLLFNEGGQPFGLDDLEFLQSSLLGGIAGFAYLLPEGFHGELHIPSRHEADQTLKWGTGLVVIKGEIAWLPAGSLPYNSSNTYYIKLVDSDTKPREYEDGNTHPTRHETEARVTTEVTEGDRYIKIDKRFALLASTTPEIYSVYSPESPEIVIGSITCLDVPESNVRIVSGTLFGHTNGLKSPEGGDLYYIGLYSPANDANHIEKLRGGCFVSEKGLPTGCSIHLDDGYIYLYDRKGEAIKKTPGSTPIDFAYIKRLA